MHADAAAAGLLLREAIEDLEWTGGAVEFVLKRSPSRFALRSVKQQSLEVRRAFLRAGLHAPSSHAASPSGKAGVYGGVREVGSTLPCPASPQITFPQHVLDSFCCHEDEVCASYKHKHLKAAFTHVAQRDPWSAKARCCCGSSECLASA